MKKKVLSIILVVAMVLSMVSTMGITAGAASGPADGKGAYSSNINISNNGINDEHNNNPMFGHNAHLDNQVDPGSHHTSLFSQEKQEPGADMEPQNVKELSDPVSAVELPVTVKSEEYQELYVAGVLVTEQNADNILSGGDNDGKVSYDFDTNTLEFADDTSIQSVNYCCIYSYGIELNVVVGKNCEFSSSGDVAFYVECGSLSISGSCEEAGLTVYAEDYSAICTYGNLSITGCKTVDIDAGWNGIYSGFGDVNIDNCGTLDIDANYCGICAYYVNTDEEVEYTCSVNICNCTSVNIASEDGSVIYAGAVWSTEGDYRFGGDVTISNCESIINILNNVEFENAAILAYGEVNINGCKKVDIDTATNGINSNYGVNIIGCEEVDIDAGWGGIYSCYGDVSVDNCGTVDIDAGWGIYQGYVNADDEIEYTCSITISNSTSVNVTAAIGNAIYAGAVWDTDDWYRFGGNITISNCEGVVLNNAASEADAVYACGGVNIVGCKTVDIDAGWNGIYAYCGDVLVDDCGTVDIDANCYGIYQDYVNIDKEVEYTCSITISNCTSVDITTVNEHTIYAGALWSIDEDYRFGGDITISNCEGVVLNNTASEYSAIAASGGVNIMDCKTVDIDAGWSGVVAKNGDLRIDNSGMEIDAPVGGLCSYGNLVVENSNIKAICELSEDFINKNVYGLPSLEENEYAVDTASCVWSEGNVTVKDSTLDLTAGDIGYDASTDPDLWKGLYSNGIFASALYINDSDVTARAGKADYSNGIRIGEMTVSGSSIVNAYGAEGKYYPSGLYSWGDIVLNGKNVEVNLYKGSCVLDPDDEDYSEDALFAGWWKDEDNDDQIVMPSLTIKNGAKLNADCCVGASNVTIDGGKVKINTSIGNALWAGGYIDKDDINTYFGKLTIKNASSVIAVSTQSSKSTTSAVYSYDSMEISDSEFFASAVTGDAIGCAKDKIDFNGVTVNGSKLAVNYSDRTTVNTKANIGYLEFIDGDPEWEYTALIGDDIALTVYVDDTCTYKRDTSLSAAGGCLGLKLKGRDKGEFTFIPIDGSWYIMNSDGKYLNAVDGKLILGDTPDTAWTYRRDAFSVTVRNSDKKDSGRGSYGTFKNNRTITYYLSTVDSGNELSTNQVRAEFYQTVVRIHDYHRTPVYVDSSCHKYVCKKCGEIKLEEHVYNEKTHKCICGAEDPDYSRVTGITVSEEKLVINRRTGFRTRKTITEYKYTITPQTKNGRVKKVEYSKNNKRWDTGTVLVSGSELDTFYIRVTDKNGNVTKWKYAGGKVSKVE